MAIRNVIKHLTRYASVMAISLVGIALSVFAFITVSDWDLQKIREQFKEDAGQRVGALRKEIETDLHVLESVKAYYIVSSCEVTREKFKSFVIQFLTRHKSIQALEWIPRVVDSERAAYEEAARKDGFPEFQITDRKTQGVMMRSPQRKEYFPVYFVEPYRGNEIALGFDLGSNPERLEALNLSRDTGELVASSRIQLVQETQGQFGFLVFAPIYREGVPIDSIESRRKNFQGFALGVFRIGDIVEKSLSYFNHQDMDIYLFDSYTRKEEAFLYHHASNSTTEPGSGRDIKGNTDFEYIKTLDVAGRKWSFLCRPSCNYVAARRSWQPWLVLVMGLLLTGLITAYLCVNMERTKKIERLVQERTDELERANQRLSLEVDVRKQTEEELQKAHDELEIRVKERTKELSITNQLLSQEITERRQVEEALRNSEARLKLQIGRMPIGCILCDPDFHILSWNPAAESMFGFAESEVLGKHPFDLIVPESSRERVNSIMNRLSEGEPITRNENENMTKDGRTIFCDWSNTALKDADGKVVGVLSMIQDVTARRQIARALELSVKHWENTFNSISEGIWLLNQEGRILQSNGKFEHLLQKDGEAVTGSLCHEVLCDFPDFTKDCPFERMKETGRRVSVELEDKERGFWFRITVDPNLTKSGAVEGGICILRNITDYKRAEIEKEKMQAQILQMQKMEAIGTLAGGVAHDFNNMLTIIQGHAQLAMSNVDENDPMYQDLDEVLKASTRASNLTRQLLLFSRKQPMEVTSLNLNGRVDGLLKMLRRLIGEDIAIHTELDPNLQAIQGDPGKIEQVIMNIAVNARDAMPRGGKLTIKTENVHIDEGYCKIYPYARPGEFLCLAIKDTGCGMDPETIKHIFDPFFTTKGVGRGTGLGLSVVYGIVEQHEGWINVQSEPGRFSRFLIYFPANSVKPEEAKEEKIDSHDLRGKGELILLVEDEEAVRKFAQILLTKYGYAVVEARTVKEASQIFQEREKVDLVFSDVILPDGTGLELVDSILSYNPKTRVLFGSGYTDHKSHWPVIKEKGYPFVSKPYNITDLLRAVGKVMSSELR